MAGKVRALAPSATEGTLEKRTAAREEPVPVARTDVREVDSLLESVAELGSELTSLRRESSALERARHLAEVLHHRLGLRAQDGRGGSQAKLRAMSEELLLLLTAIGRNVVQGSERLERELKQVGEGAERLRLVPASAMLGVLERAARDAAVSVGRQVEFEAIGREIRIDPDLLSPVQAALVQAVRNSVAHGIEKEDERLAAGKPRLGKVTVEIGRLGSRIRFICRDDGRGVDFDGVRRALERRGTPAFEAKKFDERRLLELLLAGGISTSGAVTSVSGRGVGLDVVRETAKRLGGSARLSSDGKRGTLLEMVVPFSSAALDALVVEADGHVAAIPLDAVRRTLRVRPYEVARSAEGESIVVDGAVVPFSPLARALHAGQRVRDDARAWSAVIIESGGAAAAVGVDRLLGTETVVARALPEAMPGHAMVAGAILDSVGNPRLLLDPEGLVTAASAASPEAQKGAAPLQILVIDDSLTTRMLEQSILESAGYEVDLAVSAEEGLEKAHQRRYALFLVDVEMPGMDGFQFVEHTRADATLKVVPAILVTSRSSDADRRRGEAAGASAYIVKGEFDQTELLTRIRRLVS
jgi:two-component system chemotaxis sensor kinase CheA